jgi:sugar phosphate isomerase/epimerase
LDVVCLDSRIGSWARPVSCPFGAELAELDVLAAQCAALGCRYIRIMSYPNAGLPEPQWARLVLDRIRRLTERAERHGITLLHENCSGWAGASAERALRLLDTVDSPALRLLFDTGNGVAHGYPAVDMVRELAGRVAHVHVKDAVATPAGPRYTLPGDGACGVAECLRVLLDADYSGALCIEPHLDAVPHQGIPAGAAAVRNFRAAAARLRHLIDTTVLTGQPGHDRVIVG